jgi:hypothetical protein
VVDIRAAGIPAEDTAGRVVKADRVVGMADRAVMRAPVDQAADPVDHAAASGNISARRKFASFVSRRWT